MMHIALIERIDPTARINKDQMGGYGIGLSVGGSRRARAIEHHKRVRNVPVLTLGYIAALFTRQGHSVEVISDGAISSRADLVILYSSIVESSLECAYLDRVRLQTQAVTGVVGPFAGHMPQIYAAHADFIVCGEPEAVMRDIAAGAAIPQGTVHAEPIQDMNTFPHPDWSVFPLESYSYYPLLLERPFVTVQASRGCDFLCTYCPYAAYYGRVRQRTAAHVLDELKHLKTQYGIRGVMFRDPLFTIHASWVEELMTGMLSADLHMTFGCETRMDLLNAPLIALMQQAGLRVINCGVESVDHQVLRSADRNMSFEKLESEVRNCESQGIKVAAFYVFGLPADTEQTIRATIKFAKRLNTFVAQFHVNTPFPGTKVYDQVKDRITDHDWSHYDSFTPVFTHPNLTEAQLVRLRHAAFTSYYFRPAYLTKHGGKLLEGLLSSRQIPRYPHPQFMRETLAMES
jgi:anaerobic magnesium-protoporphyrin IX monomethyl ester cyclase